MDLSKLSIAGLRTLQDSVKQELKKREQQDVTVAREKILAIAKSVGISVSELVGGVFGVGQVRSLCNTGIRMTSRNNGLAEVVSRSGLRHG